MSSLQHEMDPRGDAKLVVRNPNSQIFFSPPTLQYLEKKESQQSARSLVNTPRNQHGPFSATASGTSNPLPSLSTVTGNMADLPTSPIVIANIASGGLVVAAGNPDRSQEEPPCPSEATVQFKVSSKHLTLSSSIFRAMLTGPWKESFTPNDPLRSIPTSEWDIEALAILLNIIHGHHRRVPETLSLELFAKFAVIVDYYDCHEIVEIFVKQWHRDLKRSPPERYGRDCLLHMCVAWVFKWSGSFETMTELALRHTDRLVDAINLPIAHVLERIDERRQDHIYQILSDLRNLRNDLCDEKHACSTECSIMLLGSLIKEMHKISPIDSPIVKPYTDHSIADLIDRVSNFQSPRWYSKGDVANNRRHVCNLRQKVQPIVDDAEGRLKGFQLDDF